MRFFLDALINSGTKEVPHLSDGGSSCQTAPTPNDTQSQIKHHLQTGKTLIGLSNRWTMADYTNTKWAGQLLASPQIPFPKSVI